LAASLGSGGEARAVYSFNPTSALKNCVYKEYKPGTGDDNKFLCLSDLLDMVETLDAATKDRLKRYCVMPLKVVVDDVSHLLGTLMPRFGSSYRCKTPSTSSLDAKLAMYLCNDKKVRGLYGLNPLKKGDRKSIAAQCASFIRFLHKHGFVYGDISLNNILIHDARHTPLFLDCDGILSLKRGVGFIRQGHTPDWYPPEGFVPCSTETDVYKLALLIVRLFDKSSSPFQAKFHSDSARRGITSVFGHDAWDAIVCAGSERPQDRPSSLDILGCLVK
jgi:serine/threonine protein kinase